MVDVVATDEFEAWYLSLAAGEQDSVDFVVGLLQDRGVTLGFPHSSAIKGASVALRELRVTGRQPLRVFYAFDPRRAAVLLIGGDKTGDDRFYETMIRVAEKIWEQYLAEQARGEHEEP